MTSGQARSAAFGRHPQRRLAVRGRDPDVTPLVGGDQRHRRHREQDAHARIDLAEFFHEPDQVRLDLRGGEVHELMLPGVELPARHAGRHGINRAVAPGPPRFRQAEREHQPVAFRKHLADAAEVRRRRAHLFREPKPSGAICGRNASTNQSSRAHTSSTGANLP